MDPAQFEEHLLPSLNCVHYLRYQHAQHRPMVSGYYSPWILANNFQQKRLQLRRHLCGQKGNASKPVIYTVSLSITYTLGGNTAVQALLIGGRNIQRKVPKRSSKTYLYVVEPCCSYIGGIVVARMSQLDRGRTTLSQNTATGHSNHLPSGELCARLSSYPIKKNIQM
ncbi:unnamed protein product [Parnassius mnemosyne]|uniref:Uncharacterized protein n=1 Tax=Parnassius mnemosyne TaxID=213953 RepID=A0AAV1KZC5_9NEOP